MTLPENALRYGTCSLQELRQFVTDRKIPFKYTHAQSHTKKSQTKKEKNERRKLVAALQRADATAIFRLLGLPLELRDEVYHHFFINQEVRYYFPLSTKGVLADDMQRIPEQIRDEMSAVFISLNPRSCEGVPSSGDIRIRWNLELFLGTGFSSLVGTLQVPEMLQVYCPGLNPCLFNCPTDRVVDIQPEFRFWTSRTRSFLLATQFAPKLRTSPSSRVFCLKQFNKLSSTGHYILQEVS